jgi:hypothetical protein
MELDISLVVGEVCDAHVVVGQVFFVCLFLYALIPNHLCVARLS